VILSEPLLTAFEVIATLAGVGYAVLAARRDRFCWVAGAVSSALAALLAGLRGLPMQSGLQLFFVAMSVYGWVSWSKQLSLGELPVGLWPFRWHVIAALVVIALSYGSAQLLAARTQAAWPLLDSLTTWFSLLATWLAARAKLENWLYWVAIDGVLVFLFYEQELPFLALLNVLFIGIAIGGYIAWRRKHRSQVVPA
jgi:nicotinamide mononucleotide transporter